MQTKLGPATHTYSCDHSIETAATATASSPHYFDSLQQQKTGTKLRGSLDLSNPAQVTLLEAKYLWPHALEQHPDLLLSVGSGYSVDPAATSSKPPTMTVSAVGCTETEATWHRTFGRYSDENPTRYVRLRPKFPSPLPKGDDTETLNSGLFEEITKEFLQDDQLRTETRQDDLGSKIDLIFRRLISTTFYFCHNPGSPTESGVSGMDFGSML